MLEWAKILIPALVSIAICIMNNNLSIKKDREKRDQQYLQDMEAIRKDNSKAIAEIKDDFMAHLEELIATQQDLMNEIKIVKLNYENLKNEVTKHNQVIERTYKLENRMDVVQEKQRVANKRIEDLEDETKAIRKSRNE